ncbi:MAG TPA: type II secretion system protein GspG [Myxococcaceae bacterium]|jgi:hypothetical protein
MTSSPIPSRELRWILNQFTLLVGYALGCLTLMSMFAALLAFFYGWPLETCSRADRATLDIKNIRQGLQLYWLEQGHYPSPREGLRALVDAGALEAIPRDPWNTEYHYTLHQGVPLVWSLGADGVAGGEGQNRDQYSDPLPP